jgi:nucleotide-binding universal stress UspA family protein
MTVAVRAEAVLEHIVAVDDSTDTAAAVPVIASWQQAFGSPAVQLVEVVPFAVTVGAGAGRREFGAECMSRRLAEVGVESPLQTLTSGDPATRLDRFARDIPNSVLLAMSTHWVSRRPHLHSTARALARRSSSPVLVVPAV